MWGVRVNDVVFSKIKKNVGLMMAQQLKIHNDPVWNSESGGVFIFYNKSLYKPHYS